MGGRGVHASTMAGALAWGWWLVALAATVAGYLGYLASLRFHLVRPNRASWLIWSAATAVEAATYAALNPHAPQRWVFGLAALACVGVTGRIWTRGRWRGLDATETACVAAALAAMLLWLAARQTLWAHLLVVAAIPVSFWPTWRSVALDRARERSPAWGLWTVGDLATLLVATGAPGTGAGTYAYLLVELACHASIWLLVGLGTIYPWRSLGVRHGGLRAVDGYLPEPTLFTVREGHLGKAVHAAQPFREGDLLVRFSGPHVAAAKLPARLAGRRDRFVQVSADQYLGPSGAIDDLVNHSCLPNAGLRFTGDGVFLIAVRDIAVGEEIAWDYSTTLSDRSWQMACRCGAPDCRGVIGAFETLPPDRQEWYRARNLVAPYLRRSDRVGRAA